MRTWLPPAEITAALALGAILLIGALWLLLRQQVFVDHTGNVVDIKISVLGHIRARSWVVAPFAIGAFLVGLPLWKGYEKPQTLPVSGRISFADGRSASGIIVGVLPTSSHATLTIADGSYRLNIPRGALGETYQAVVHVSNSNPPEFVLGVVKFDADSRGAFDYTFTRRNR